MNFVLRGKNIEMIASNNYCSEAQGNLIKIRLTYLLQKDKLHITPKNKEEEQEKDRKRKM